MQPPADGQSLAARLADALAKTCPPEYGVTRGVEVRVDRSRWSVPDVLVLTGEAAARGPSHVAAREVVLAVEIVAPGPVTRDRLSAPALYAQAGIPFYWRVETAGGIVVHTHWLDPGPEIYVPIGEFAQTLEVGEPWRIRLPLATIAHRDHDPGAEGDRGR